VNTRDSARVTVGRIVRPHGIRGEVAAEILTDFPERLAHLSRVELRHDGPEMPPDEGRSVCVRSCRFTTSRGGQAIFLFEGCESMTDARKLVGLHIQIPAAERKPLPSGTYYESDLIGCEVRAIGGSVIGCVREVQQFGEGLRGTPILAVDSQQQGEVLIPLAQDICIDVDLASRRITVDLPEGLYDLNARS